MLQKSLIFPTVNKHTVNRRQLIVNAPIGESVKQMKHGTGAGGWIRRERMAGGLTLSYNRAKLKRIPSLKRYSFRVMEGNNDRI